jgi:hypothetical protein
MSDRFKAESIRGRVAGFDGLTRTISNIALLFWKIPRTLHVPNLCQRERT